MEVASGIAGLIGLAITITQISHRYFASVSRKSSAIQSFFRELASLKLVLERLKDISQNPEFGRHASCLRSAIGINECHDELDTLRQKLQKRTRDNALSGALHRLIWPFEEHETQRIVTTLQRYQNTFVAALSADNYEVGTTILKAIENLRNDQLEARPWNTYAWLSPVDVSTNQKLARSKHEPRTGDWLLSLEAYTQWLQYERQTLWLHGIPGCGKTIICSTIIEDVRRRQDVRDAVVYFYFDFSDDHKQSIQACLRSLLAQLCDSAESLPEEVQQLFERHQRLGAQENFETEVLLESISALCRLFRRTFVIIDALDECSERAVLLEALVSVIEGSTSVSLLMTSRRERDIDIILGERVTHTISMIERVVDADIRLHIQACLRDDVILKRRDEAVKQEIEDVLVEGARGMFRWVVCQLSILRNCLTRNVLRKALDSLPGTLDATYDRILLNIDPEYQRQAVIALRLLVYSSRPVKLTEVAEAVAVWPLCKAIDMDDRLFDPRDVMTICSSLVTLNEDSQELALAHYSVKEYLISGRIIAGPAAAFGMNAQIANANLAEICLTYLLSFDEENSIYENVHDDYPLLQYAAEHWFDHIRLGSDNANCAQGNLCCRLLDKTKGYSFLNWIRLFDPEARYRQPIWPESLATLPSPLYYMSLLGHFDIVQMLLKHGEDPNCQGGEFGTPLQAAARLRHSAIVNLLISSGARVDFGAGKLGSALNAAAFGGDVKITEVILRAGANINEISGDFGSALHAATANHSTAAFELLLSSGADISSIGGGYGTVLLAASCSGNTEVTNLLLAAGADPNFGECFRSEGLPLHTAAFNCHASTVAALLKGGADVNRRSGIYGTALQAATAAWKRLNMEVMRTLLDHGADVNAQGGYYNTAVQAAVAEQWGDRCRDSVQMLVDAGADPLIQGGKYGSALHAANTIGRRDIKAVLCSNLDLDHMTEAIPLPKRPRNTRGLPDILWGPFETVLEAKRNWDMAGGESFGKFEYNVDYIAISNESNGS